MTVATSEHGEWVGWAFGGGGAVGQRGATASPCVDRARTHCGSRCEPACPHLQEPSTAAKQMEPGCALDLSKTGLVLAHSRFPLGQPAQGHSTARVEARVGRRYELGCPHPALRSCLHHCKVPNLPSCCPIYAGEWLAWLLWSMETSLG